jgi:hypothetical protein
MRRRWEAFWVLFSTGYDPKHESIEEDSTPTRADRRRDGSYCGRPACPSGGGQATCPQIRGTDLKVLGFTTSVLRSRATVPCLPAAGVFLAGDSASIINPPRPAVSSAAKHRGVQDADNLAWKLWQRCSTARLVLRSTRYIPITMNGTQSDCSLYMQQRPLPGLAPAWVKASRYPTHRLRGGDDGLHRYTARRPYSARRRTSLYCP